MKNIPVSESDWEAERDARTITEADAIKADKSRLKKAAIAARRMADEAKAKAKSMNKLAKKAAPKKAAPKKAAPKKKAVKRTTRRKK